MFAVPGQESGRRITYAEEPAKRFPSDPIDPRNSAKLYRGILRGGKGRGFSYAHGDIPIEVEDVELAKLLPGKAAEVKFSFSRLEVPHCVRFGVMRPTRVRAYSLEWQP
jgi:hypothetical protein